MYIISIKLYNNLPILVRFALTLESVGMTSFSDTENPKLPKVLLEAVPENPSVLS